MCLTGGKKKKHRLFPVLCLSVPNEDLFCAFSESMHSFSRMGFFWGMLGWRKHSECCQDCRRVLSEVCWSSVAV